MLQETAEFINMVNRVEIAIRKLPQRAATHAVNFSKERFRAQNWVDDRTEPWQKRKGRDKRKGRGVLIDSGRLRRSIRKVIVTDTYAIIGTDVPYARAHNDGFRGTVTVKAHRRKGHEVRGHIKRMNLPRRRFLGASAVLEQQLNRMIVSEITKSIKGNY